MFEITIKKISGQKERYFLYRGKEEIGIIFVNGKHRRIDLLEGKEITKDEEKILMTRNLNQYNFNWNFVKNRKQHNEKGEVKK